MLVGVRCAKCGSTAVYFPSASAGVCVPSAALAHGLPSETFAGNCYSCTASVGGGIVPVRVVFIFSQGGDR